ncbi:MAG: cardiolipin synthase B [Acidobacteria bacterium]|nr:cardiolipin synthase B [Acidobacteriota bacterium]
MGLPGHKAARELADQALSRAAGANLTPGNRIRLLKDGAENYPAWIAAIKSAIRWIHFETYIIHEDRIGRQFAELLCAKAQEGVSVRLIYDWMGSFGTASNSFWQRLAQAGVEVRCYNPPSLDSPFGWLSRDHRKMIAVDGVVAYLGGLCVGQPWMGIAERKIAPWRDTGVEIEGPAVADIECAFADSWASIGDPLDSHELPAAADLRPAGEAALRVLATVPNTTEVYRIDHLITTLAQHSVWLADAYFLGTGAYVQALQAAARSGVDVRLLVPGSNDVMVMRAISRAGLRPLLEAGVRVFEWNGSMMHAKTAVVDSHWSRVGSTNLNLASWLANRELDVLVEDEDFGRQMEEAYVEDLSNSTEIVLDKRRRHPHPTSKPPARRYRQKRAGSARRTAVGVIRLSHSLGAALSNRRELGPAEAVIILWGAALLAFLAAIAFFWPRSVAFPLAILCLWTAVSLAVRAFKLRFPRRKRGRHSSSP